MVESGPTPTATANHMLELESIFSQHTVVSAVCMFSQATLASSHIPVTCTIG